MQKLTRFVPVLLSIGALNGCSNATPAPSQFDNSAVDVNESLSALTASDDDQTLNAFNDMVSVAGDGEAADADGKDSDGGVDEGSGKGGPPLGGKLNRLKRGPAPHGRGHGLGLLLWYADLDALKVCQDLRATCATSADPAACKVQVKECVKPVLEAAFKALCDERVAQCDASGRNEHGCEQIKNACGVGDSSTVGGDQGGQSGDHRQGPGEGAGGAGAHADGDGDRHPMLGAGGSEAAEHDAAGAGGSGDAGG